MPDKCHESPSPGPFRCAIEIGQGSLPFLPAHVTVLAVVADANERAVIFSLIPVHDAFHVCGVEAHNLPSLGAAQAIHSFQLECRQPFADVSRVMLLQRRREFPIFVNR